MANSNSGSDDVSKDLRPGYDLILNVNQSIQQLQIMDIVITSLGYQTDIDPNIDDDL